MAMIFSLQSCISSNENEGYNFSVNLKGYNHINEIGVENSLRLKAAKYALAIDVANMTMDLDVTGAYVSDGEEITLYFRDVKLSYSQTEGYSFSLQEVTPTSSNGRVYKITNFSGKISFYALSNSSESTSYTQITVLQAGYTIDSQYEVFTTCETSMTSLPEIYYTNCSTTTTAATDGISPFSTTVTTYLVNFTSSTEADVYVRSAQFAQRMPQMTMVFPSVKVSLTENGYVLSADEITPKINDTPMPSYKVTDFNMQMLSKGSSAKVKFNCNISDVDYTVNASCKLLPEATSSL